MRRPHGSWRRLFAALALAALLPASGAGAQTVEDVVRRYVEARGGLARLRAVRTLRLTGTIELPGLPPSPFTLELKRPARMRTVIRLEGHEGVRAFDGESAWLRPPVPGEAARPMSEEDAAEARAQADLDLSPLVDARAKGYSVELVGRDRVPGGETFKLLVRGGGLPDRTLHVDTRSHLVVRTEERRRVDGRETDFVTEIGDYRAQAGLLFPRRIEVGPRGSAERQRLQIRSVEVNPPLDDARFSPPAGSRPGAGRSSGPRPRAVLP